VDNARSRLEPVIADTEKRAKAAQKDVGDAEQKIGDVRRQLDGTAALADEQRTRITDQGGHIKHKLEDVQKAADRANSLSSGYEARATVFERELNDMRKHAEDYSRKLDDMQKSFDARMKRVSKQVDDVSIQQAYHLRPTQ
jgi:peptidoglycan hydrolase CwlO-like protein